MGPDGLETCVSVELTRAAFAALLAPRCCTSLKRNEAIGASWAAPTFYPTHCQLTILISPATPAPYRYTGCRLASFL
jgi:hypothetical protein